MRYDEVNYGYFDGTGTYHAYVKDHQGNVRAVVAAGEVVERDDYYPYGMPIVGVCTPSAEGIQPLKYTSKELHWGYQANGQLSPEATSFRR